MATVTKPTIDDLMPEVVEFATDASDLIQICTGAKWKGDPARGRLDADVEFTSSSKGVTVTTRDGAVLVTWKTVADWVKARWTPELLDDLRAAYRTYCDVCMESVATWEDHRTDPEHRRLLDEHNARYDAATDALVDARRAITHRGVPATTAGTADPEPADEVPPPLPVKSGPHDVPGLGVVTITPAGWKVLWAAQRAGAAGIDQKGITAPAKLRLFDDELIAETNGRLHLTHRGVVLVDWLNRDHQAEPVFRLVGRYQPGDGTHDGDQVEYTFTRKKLLAHLRSGPAAGPSGFWEGLFETADELTQDPDHGYAYRIDWEHPETTGHAPDPAPAPALELDQDPPATNPGDEPVSAETPAQLMAGLGLTSWIPDYPWPLVVSVLDDSPVVLTEDMAHAIEAMHRAGSTDWFALDVTDDTGGRLVSGGLARENLSTLGLVMLTPAGRELGRWLDPDWPDAAVTVDGPHSPSPAVGVPSLTGELVELVELEHCSRERAEELTDAIRGQLGDLWDLVKIAYQERAWVPLGHASWDAYCAAEFTGKWIRLPREERPDTVRSLRDAGMSVRAIAAATGLGRGTVARAIDDTPGVPNGTPEPDAEAFDLGAEHAPPAKVTGADGKRYDRTRPTPDPAPPATTAGPDPTGQDDQPWEEPPLFTPPPATVIGTSPAATGDTLVAECTAAIDQFRAAVEQLEMLTVELDDKTTPVVLDLWRGHLIYADAALGDVRHLIGLPRPARAGAA